MLDLPVLSRRPPPPETSHITVHADVQPTPNGKGYDAFTLCLDHKTGAYIRRGRVFRCAKVARRWLSRQSVEVKP